MNSQHNVEQLVEKWSNVEGKMSIASIEDRYIKENLAILLENQESKDLKRELIPEASQGYTTGTVAQTHAGLDGAFSPISLALVRRTMPELFANKIVGVQAMNGPVGLAYALRTVYKNNTSIEAGFDEVPKFSGFTGSTSGTSGTADAGTGVSGSVGEGWTIGSAMPEISLKIDKVALEAKTRKLAASFSLEAAQDIQAMHGVNIEREMVNILQYEIQAELDRELLAACKTAAYSSTTLDISATDGRWGQEKLSYLLNKIIKECNDIGTRTRRGVGNFVVVSPNIATALQAIGSTNGIYTQNIANVNPSNTFAEVGMLNGTIKVFRDTYATTDNVLAGYKGPGVSDCGIVYSPYIMGLFNRAMAQEDFSPRIGVMSRYAITSSLLGASRYYTKFTVSNLTDILV
jgi:hypothetical protein